MPLLKISHSQIVGTEYIVDANYYEGSLLVVMAEQKPPPLDPEAARLTIALSSNSGGTDVCVLALGGRLVDLSSLSPVEQAQLWDFLHMADQSAAHAGGSSAFFSCLWRSHLDKWMCRS